MATSQSPLRQRASASDEATAPANSTSPPAISPLTDWPRDENGEPMIQVVAGAREIIGLVNHSNVMVGPSSIGLFVKRGQKSLFENPDDREALAAVVNDLHQLIEVDVVAEQRGIVLDTIDPARVPES